MFTIVVISQDSKRVVSNGSSRAWARAQGESLALTLDPSHTVQVLNRQGEVTVSFKGRAPLGI